MFNINHIWYRKSIWHPIILLLLPLSWLFSVIVMMRRWSYRLGLLKQYALPAPIIMVGNISVGGTGKTPFVIRLVQFLKSKGLRPGIISRGYGGLKHRHPLVVQLDSNPEYVGDEALLLVRNTACPLVVCTDKVKAASKLITEYNCDVVVSDDGLQHYRLSRDLEIVIIDGMRGLGNLCMLPAGPLRESKSRLEKIDYVIVNDVQGEKVSRHFSRQYHVSLKPIEWVAVNNASIRIPLQDFKFQAVHAVAAIGHPERFFMTLRHLGLNIIEHALPDHYMMKAKDIHFDDNLPVVMTEKDAVKCATIATNNCWYLRSELVLCNELEEQIYSRITSLKETTHGKIDDKNS